uniref:FGENESH: predicted gene_16.32 protein n=1 Tax=Rhodotorula toruloides TaxID=5286 RepID=A0A0K3CRL5_RHOTO
MPSSCSVQTTASSAERRRLPPKCNRDNNSYDSASSGHGIVVGVDVAPGTGSPLLPLPPPSASSFCVSVLIVVVVVVVAIFVVAFVVLALIAAALFAIVVVRFGSAEPSQVAVRSSAKLTCRDCGQVEVGFAGSRRVAGRARRRLFHLRQFPLVPQLPLSPQHRLQFVSAPPPLSFSKVDLTFTSHPAAEAESPVCGLFCRSTCNCEFVVPPRHNLSHSGAGKWYGGGYGDLKGFESAISSRTAPKSSLADFSTEKSASSGSRTGSKGFAGVDVVVVIVIGALQPSLSCKAEDASEPPPDLAIFARAGFPFVSFSSLPPRFFGSGAPAVPFGMLFVSSSAAFTLPAVHPAGLPVSCPTTMYDPNGAPAFLAGSARTLLTPPTSPTRFSTASIISSSDSLTLGTPCTTRLNQDRHRPQQGGAPDSLTLQLAQRSLEGTDLGANPPQSGLGLASKWHRCASAAIEDDGILGGSAWSSAEMVGLEELEQVG